MNFIELLKKKGTGPTMSKSLWGTDFLTLESGFHSSEISLTTKATMFTALLTLPPNPEEAKWLQTAIAFLPTELQAFLSPSKELFLGLTQKAIRHENLSESEFILALDFLFDPKTPEYLKGAFLEAERLKRETLVENNACYEYFWNKSQRWETKVPVLVDLSLAYDGMNRHPLIALLVAPLLASVGIPCVLHGLDDVAPKKGINPFKILKAAGKNPLRNPLEDIENPDIGWGYIDQSLSFPELYALKKMRSDMVKRPILATMEKLLQPIRAKNGNLLVTGYTHPPYKDMLFNVLRTHNHSPQFLILRGQEGSIQLPLDRRAPFAHSDGSSDYVRPPKEYPKTEPDRDITVEESLEAGLKALHQDGMERDYLSYLAQVIIEKFNLRPNSNFDFHKALNHWDNLK